MRILISVHLQSQQAQDNMHEDGGAGDQEVAMEENIEQVRLSPCSSTAI